jgi:hypothetical protein
MGLGGIFGGITDTLGITDSAGDALKDANRISARNEKYLRDLKVPEHMWDNLIAESYNPEEMQFQTIGEDPALRGQQLNALARLGGLAENGLSDVDALGFEKARQLGNQQARSGREAALQDAQARGVAGSGLEFALREQANQGGAQRAQEAALNQAAESSRQRAQYQMAYNQALSGQRGQDLQANKANTDIINQFNQANTQNRNQAQMANMQNRQDAFKYNQEGKQGTAQQNFSNEMEKRKAVAGIADQQRQAALAKSASASQMQNSMIGAGAQIGAAALMSDKRAKENIKPANLEIESLLGKLKPYSFDYKDESHGQGKQTGIMAQDLEKSKAGRGAVLDTPGGKMVDGAKASTLALAALANLNDRLKKLEG